MDVAWRQSRYDKEGPGGDAAAYINCPMDKAQYEAFIDALLAGPKSEFKDWEHVPYFDGCLPIEVMAERGRETLRHGPMKPVGLTNPRDPLVKAHAIVQLRQDNALGTLWNMVGFQTKLKHGAQTDIFRMIPGLEKAVFARLGGLHRNTFLNSPRLLDGSLRLKADPRLRFAGQVTGVEGYVESAAVGLLAGRFAAAERLGRPIVGAAADDRAGRPGRPHHRRAPGGRQGLVPADEHQLRPAAAAMEARPTARGRGRQTRSAATRRDGRAKKRLMGETRALADLAPTWADRARLGEPSPHRPRPRSFPRATATVSLSRRAKSFFDGRPANAAWATAGNAATLSACDASARGVDHPQEGRTQLRPVGEPLAQRPGRAAGQRQLGVGGRVEDLGGELGGQARRCRAPSPAARSRSSASHRVRDSGRRSSPPADRGAGLWRWITSAQRLRRRMPRGPCGPSNISSSTSRHQVRRISPNSGFEATRGARASSWS